MQTLMKKYRKLPLPVNALKLTKDNFKQIKDKFPNSRILKEPTIGLTVGLLIDTPEGSMICTFGNYIIQGIKGEFYSCKASIFEASYEEVTE